MSNKTFYVEPEKCTGCRNCELACSYAHMVDGKLGASRIRAYTIKPSIEKGIVVTCLQCDSAACVSVCPTNALQRNMETGAIEVKYDMCINCHACVSACPFGNMSIEPINDRVIKCDLCGGTPQCVLYCPTGAIEYK